MTQPYMKWASLLSYSKKNTAFEHIYIYKDFLNMQTISERGDSVTMNKQHMKHSFLRPRLFYSSLLPHLCLFLFSAALLGFSLSFFQWS